jgi:hypothetical protein
VRLPEPPEWTPAVTVLLTVLVLVSTRLAVDVLAAIICLTLLYVAAAGLVRLYYWWLG